MECGRFIELYPRFIIDTLDIISSDTVCDDKSASLVVVIANNMCAKVSHDR